jgi:NADPH-dependent 2,4-dienoyl-CoA reductase/sulfur reductase-like enzyme
VDQRLLGVVLVITAIVVHTVVGLVGYHWWDMRRARQDSLCPRPDVVIAGAGPSGLALACGLLAGGAAVRLVDKAAEPAITSRALVTVLLAVQRRAKNGAAHDVTGAGRALTAVLDRGWV